MESKFYTIDQVAEILGMHHKTIRKFIADGALEASKIGKQWRISDKDLNAFMEKDTEGSNDSAEEDKEVMIAVENTDKSIPKVAVSTVIDINETDKEQYMRISNTLIAAMNSRRNDYDRSTLNMKYNEKEKRLRIILWGTIKFTQDMLDTAEMLTNAVNS